MYKVKQAKVSELKPNPKNPRTISQEKLEELKSSLRKYPRLFELRPLVVDKNGVVLGGNMRLRAAQELGLDTVPVIEAENLTAKERRRFILLDNVTYGEWDTDILGKHFAPAELDELGIDLPDILPPQYKALQIEEGDAEIADMARNTKRAILIEFSHDDYGEAFELIKRVRKSGKDVGKLILKLLRKELSEK
jgi:hypothetical protein